ncbi:MAG: preprotein translocase subunit Sec61beta [archaeon]
MASDNRIHMPSGFGGLLRYDEEYESKFKLKPEHVIVFIVLVLLFVIILNLFFPIA